MFRRFWVACLWFSVSTLLAYGQDDSKVEIFGGYQYLHASTGVSGVSSFNLNGWNASMSGYFTRNLGVTADFGGAYGTPSVLGVGAKTRLYTFLLGPIVRFPNSSRLTPLAHALFGGGRISGDVLGVSASETDFTWTAGGGLRARTIFGSRPASCSSFRLVLVRDPQVGGAALESLPRRMELRSPLPVPHDLPAAHRVYIPDERLFRESLQSEFARLDRTRPASPNYAKLSFHTVVLYVEKLAGFDLRSHVLQDRTEAADTAHAGQLHEWPGITIHAPDAHRQSGVDSCLPSAVH
jgi:hypothetical protein